MPELADKPPFGLPAVVPAFDRATRLAKALFNAADSAVVLISDGRIWRNRDGKGALTTDDPAAEQIMRDGEPLWIEDALVDVRVKDQPVVTQFNMRFYAGVPVQLSDGSCPGVLCVIGQDPRPENSNLLNRLRDCAEMVSDACERAIALRAAQALGEVDELETTKTVLAAMGATVPVSLVMTDREMRALYVSPRWLANFGLRESAVLGRSLYDIVPDYYPQFRQGFESALGGRVIRSNRVRSEHSGRVEWLSSELTPWRDKHGDVGGILVAAHYITEMVEAENALLAAKEDAEAANRAKSTFLATMSHEIRTPLNGVLGMAQAMSADQLSPLQRDRLDVIRQSGETLLAILNDVLDLSKIEAGKLELEEADFDIAELARGAHAAFTAIANKKGLSFDLAVEPAARGVWRGDSTRVRQILYNLISNALKFTEQGEVRVRVSDNKGRLQVTVSDTGIGITETRLSALFQKFEQADASTTRRYGGTGLGLAICRELVTLMGGDIIATSALGEGSTFMFTLPLPRGDKAAVPAARPAPTKAEDFAGGPIRVLAAEDNTVNQLVLKTLLHQIGVEPVVVDNGLKAVEAWEASTWDAILMDVQMPEMDGPTAAKLIRDRELITGRERTPIIALTANAMSHQVAEYMQAGMDAFVPKPIEIARLFAVLQEVLGAGDVEDVTQVA